VPVYRIANDALSRLPQITFEEAGIRERGDLQRFLRSQIEVIAPDVLVIAEEFSEWENSSRRIDLLGIDKQANLVVVELKRTQSGEHMELQALRYAAMVSAMTFDRAVEVFGRHLRKLGDESDPQQRMLGFLNWSEPDEERFAQDVSLVLASADFSQELTTTVMWLLDRGIDIRCVRLRPYKNGDELLLDVQQVIPLPEAADYQIKLREKRSEERIGTSRKDESRLLFWQQFIPLCGEKTALFSNVSPTKAAWISASSGVSGLSFACVLNRNRSHIELEIYRGNQAVNKAIFDTLAADQAVIERDFGGTLNFDRQDDNQRSLIKCPVANFGYEDVDRFPEIQQSMAELLRRFEHALKPRIESIRATL
jgi:hypothetical protein